VDKAPEPQQTDADALADWLAGLGLLDQLGPAGLPVVVRGHDGRAHWQEQATGEPLSAARLAELATLLHAQGEDPRHGVPVELVRLARQARLREELVASAWFTYASLAELWQVSDASARFRVTKAANAGTLLTVPTELALLVPAFQLDEAGEVRADLAAPLAALLGAGTDPWLVWSWWTTPAALLSGEVPQEAVRDPLRRGDVDHAARRLAGRRSRR